MFNRFLMTAALVGLTAGTASAAIVSSSFETYDGSITGVLMPSTDPDYTDNFSFTWSDVAGAEGAPYAGAFVFTSDSSFDLALGEVAGDYDNNDVSAFTLDRLDSAGNTMARLTTIDSCPSIVAPLGGTCNRFTEVGSTAGAAASAITEGTLLFAGLEAGNYRLGLIESSSPANGSAGFDYVGTDAAPVPLPAAGILLLAGLGGLGMVGRRKSA